MFPDNTPRAHSHAHTATHTHSHAHTATPRTGLNHEEVSVLRELAALGAEAGEKGNDLGVDVNVVDLVTGVEHADQFAETEQLLRPPFPSRFQRRN